MQGFGFTSPCYSFPSPKKEIVLREQLSLIQEVTKIILNEQDQETNLGDNDWKMDKKSKFTKEKRNTSILQKILLMAFFRTILQMLGNRQIKLVNDREVPGCQL